MSIQLGLDTGKSKSAPSWLQRMAANLGFASAPSLRETLESAISETGEEEDKSLSPQERTMLLNVLGFGETRVAEVMIPRADIMAIEENKSVADLFALFAQAGHSRVPVFRESLDNPTGMVHIKDAMAWATRSAGEPDVTNALESGSTANLDFGSAKLNATIAEAGLVREALFVPPSMPALTLLAKMKARKIHLALVVDEFGGIDGLVTFGDLVEAIVGDIEDEHDNSAALSIGYENEAFVASARTPIEDVEQVLKTQLTSGGVTGDVDTLGGLIMAIAGRMPKRGETVRHMSGVTFEILEAGPRRLHTVRIRKPLALAAPDQPLLLAAPASELGDEPGGRQGSRLHGARAA
ncbi:MAG: hemolysin family protein [Rhodomicrobium sp.]